MNRRCRAALRAAPRDRERHGLLTGVALHDRCVVDPDRLLTGRQGRCRGDERDQAENDQDRCSACDMPPDVVHTRGVGRLGDIAAYPRGMERLYLNVGSYRPIPLAAHADPDHDRRPRRGHRRGLPRRVTAAWGLYEYQRWAGAAFGRARPPQAREDEGLILPTGSRVAPASADPAAD